MEKSCVALDGDSFLDVLTLALPFIPKGLQLGRVDSF
jgi:hypothetical protein